MVNIKPGYVGRSLSIVNNSGAELWCEYFGFHCIFSLFFFAASKKNIDLILDYSLLRMIFLYSSILTKHPNFKYSESVPPQTTRM